MGIQIGDIIMDKSDKSYYIVRDIQPSITNPRKKKFQIAEIQDPLFSYIVGETVIQREFQKIS